MDIDAEPMNPQYVSNSVTHKIYYVGVLYLKNIVMRVAVEPWIQNEMDAIAETVADSFLDENNIMATIHELGNQLNKQNKGKIQVFKLDQVMYFYFCDENTSAPAIYSQFNELRQQLQSKFTFKTIQKAGDRKIDQDNEFEKAMKTQLHEFWKSDPVRSVYAYDQDVINSLREVEYPGSAISQQLDIIYVNINDI